MRTYLPFSSESENSIGDCVLGQMNFSGISDFLLRNKEVNMRDKVFNKKAFMKAVTEHVKIMYRKTLEDATQQEIYQAVAYITKDVIMEQWLATQRVIDKDDPKVV